MSFEDEVQKRIHDSEKNEELRTSANSFLFSSIKTMYSYNFSWMGRPIIQYPQDIVAMQEIIWKVQPDLIIETGIAHGGSLIFYASMLELNSICGGSNHGEVLGIDIDIRSNNRKAIEAHPLFRRISMIEGSSISTDVITQVKNKTVGKERVLVCLDSLHTHCHVLAELNAYAPLVTIGNYCVVFDTIIEGMPPDVFSNRPWGLGDNPKTAIVEYMKNHSEFEIDKNIEHKLLITVAPGGYLKRVK